MAKHKIGSLNELFEGKVLSTIVDDEKIGVTIIDDKVYAFKDVCTHDNAPLDQGVMEGNVITCPRHGAKFDVTTGAALGLPAVVPINTYKVFLEGMDLYIKTG